MDVGHYIPSVRVERTKNLLAFTDLTVGEIAGQLCFSSGSHFSDTFRRLTGMLPQAYGRSGFGFDCRICFCDSADAAPGFKCECEETGTSRLKAFLGLVQTVGSDGSGAVGMQLFAVSILFALSVLRWMSSYLFCLSLFMFMISAMFGFPFFLIVPLYHG